MALTDHLTDDKPVADMSRQDGNAFAIIGVCVKTARRAGWFKDDIDALYTAMTAGTYEDLLLVADTYFDLEV